ncbi:hypothetical protein SAMN05216276_105017 [Streptosporangium subroseum]|uniref:Uncharacterized protein n=1 Tax=Streptosporangium subroseum TaxID=106412 RepID=A0A239N1K9_9ACTN|nr:hypothetical protein SAMN05216276_105017 [Streptosporangium subroseum]
MAHLRYGLNHSRDLAAKGASAEGDEKPLPSVPGERMAEAERIRTHNRTVGTKRWPSKEERAQIEAAERARLRAQRERERRRNGL